MQSYCKETTHSWWLCQINLNRACSYKFDKTALKRPVYLTKSDWPWSRLEISSVRIPSMSHVSITKSI